MPPPDTRTLESRHAPAVADAAAPPVADLTRHRLRTATGRPGRTVSPTDTRRTAQTHPAPAAQPRGPVRPSAVRRGRGIRRRGTATRAGGGRPPPTDRSVASATHAGAGRCGDGADQDPAQRARKATADPATHRGW